MYINPIIVGMVIGIIIGFIIGIIATISIFVAAVKKIVESEEKDENV